MKKLCLLFSIIFMLNLAGCGASDLVDQISGGKESHEIRQTEPADPQPTEATESTATEPTQSQEAVGLLTTDYYTLTIPESWVGKCVCDVHGRDDGSYSMSVHETNAYLESGTGTLFTIMMLPESEDYSGYPSYELLGPLDTPHGTFNLIALFPTDVQFAEAHAQEYLEMNESVQDVLASLTPVAVPQGGIPEATKPADKTPEATTPKATTPKDAIAGETVPATTAPDAKKPVENVPETTAPETTAPPETEVEHSNLYISGVSVEDVILWFNEVVLDSEFSYGGNSSLVQKWTGSIRYSIEGEATEEDLRVLENFTSWLNGVKGFPGIRRAGEGESANMLIRFGDAQMIVDFLGSDYTNVDGGVRYWYSSNAIYEAKVAYKTDISQNTRNSVILEEIYNGLGLVQDTSLRSDSIIWQGYSTPQSLTQVDKLLLKLLYHPDIKCGMNAQECEAVIRSLYY